MKNVEAGALGKRLNLARGYAGLSGRRLGELAGLSTHYVSGVEASRWRDPRSEPLRRLAQVLGISLDWLLSGLGEAPDPGAVRAAAERAEAAAIAEGRMRPLKPRAARTTTPEPSRRAPKSTRRRAASARRGPAAGAA
ncbi:MAG TPA: helix-turn-helix transcriptional regulator [Polyangiaceae bacterium]|nr:helix-turn-helix transcriptional regulator [Polyangiaceae bacterium]